MFLAFMLFHVNVCLLANGGEHGGALEAFPDDVNGHACGMCHLLVEETVVTQLVEHYLVGREVKGPAVINKLVNSQQQGAPAEVSPLNPPMTSAMFFFIDYLFL